ncbi:MAG: flagellar hook assembly protein FlgD [Candidatus Sericytochromatia bacterium]|nr:flagellar hook assembly protein FlgD [Candidatus Sericytochromatia bacterium]
MANDTALVGTLKDLMGQAETRSKAKAVSKELGKDAFLNLLVAQLKNQDPLKPMEDQQFIAEMAQFSSLEQMQNLNKLMASQSQFSALSQASGLIGKEVKLVSPEADGKVVTGVVSEVRQIEGAVKLVVNGQAYDTSWISTVAQPGAQPPAPAAPKG